MIRLWTLGDLEHKILPTKGQVEQLSEILAENKTDDDVFDLVWGPAIDVKIVKKDAVHQPLGLHVKQAQEVVDMINDEMRKAKEQVQEEFEQFKADTDASYDELYKEYNRVLNKLSEEKMEHSLLMRAYDELALKLESQKSWWVKLKERFFG